MHTRLHVHKHAHRLLALGHAPSWELSEDEALESGNLVTDSEGKTDRSSLTGPLKCPSLPQSNWVGVISHFNTGPFTKNSMMNENTCRRGQ